MALKFSINHIEDSLSLFRYYKKLAEGAMEQVSDEQPTAVLDPEAINRQIAHYAYHCGQIVFLAKHLASERWKSLSIPRNASNAFNQAVAAGEKSQR